MIYIYIFFFYRSTVDYSGSDLTLLCREATLLAIRRTDRDERLSISLQMLQEARDKVKPMSTMGKSKFAEWNKKFGTS